MNIGLLDAWITGMKKAWETRDPQAAADLCSDKGFEYYENPFQEPLTTKEEVKKVWVEVPKDQSEIEFNYNIMATTKRGGVAHWWVTFYSKAAKKKINLDGVFAVKLDSRGLCTEFRQWWMKK